MATDVQRRRAIEAELTDVEVALGRLEAGTYWTCELTGEPLDDAVLEANPLARRSARSAAP